MITVLLALGAAYAATRIQLQDIDTRERLNSAAAERAIERVSGDAATKIDKIDTNVQWLIKQQIEMNAVMKRIERERD